MFAHRFLLRAVVLVLAVAAALYGQATTGQFGGTVTDASGASVPNAKVTVTNTGTGASRTVTTDQTGTYLAPLLPPGAYDVSAEAAGFKKVVQSNVELQV